MYLRGKNLHLPKITKIKSNAISIKRFFECTMIMYFIHLIHLKYTSTSDDSCTDIFFIEYVCVCVCLYVCAHACACVAARTCFCVNLVSVYIYITDQHPLSMII